MSLGARIQKEGEILEMIWTMAVSVRHRGWVDWLVAVNGSCLTGRLFLRHSPSIPWFSGQDEAIGVLTDSGSF